MTRARQKSFVRLAYIAAILAMFFSAIWIATTREPRVATSNVPELSKSEATLRALEIAQAQYDGAPQDIQITKTTIGESGVISCNPLTGWLVGLMNKLQGELDGCSPNTTVWLVELRGNFHQAAVTTDYLSVAIDGAGKFIHLNGGGTTAAPSY